MKKIVMLFGLLVIGIVLYNNFIPILYALQQFLDKVGLSISALDKTLFVLNTTESMNNGRNIVYEYAIEYFKTNPLFGLGIGGFEKKFFLDYGNDSYPHQYFLQILCEFGITGAIIIMITLKRGIKKLFFLYRRFVRGKNIWLYVFHNFNANFNGKFLVLDASAILVVLCLVFAIVWVCK